jgi:hypothetical protein
VGKKRSPFSNGIAHTRLVWFFWEQVEIRWIWIWLWKLVSFPPFFIAGSLDNPLEIRPDTGESLANMKRSHISQIDFPVITIYPFSSFSSLAPFFNWNFVVRVDGEDHPASPNNISFCQLHYKLIIFLDKQQCTYIPHIPIPTHKKKMKW